MSACYYPGLLLSQLQVQHLSVNELVLLVVWLKPRKESKGERKSEKKRIGRQAYIIQTRHALINTKTERVRKRVRQKDIQRQTHTDTDTGTVREKKKSSTETETYGERDRHRPQSVNCCCSITHLNGNKSPQDGKWLPTWWGNKTKNTHTVLSVSVSHHETVNVQLHGLGDPCGLMGITLFTVCP